MRWSRRYISGCIPNECERAQAAGTVDMRHGGPGFRRGLHPGCGGAEGGTGAEHVGGGGAAGHLSWLPEWGVAGGHGTRCPSGGGVRLLEDAEQLDADPGLRAAVQRHGGVVLHRDLPQGRLRAVSWRRCRRAEGDRGLLDAVAVIVTGIGVPVLLWAVLLYAEDVVH